MKLVALLLFITKFLSVQSITNVCPDNQCLYAGNQYTSTDWSFFTSVVQYSRLWDKKPTILLTSNTANFNPDSATTAPPIEGCDVCEWISGDRVYCGNCKVGLEFLPSGHNIWNDLKFQCAPAGCSVSNCATCTSNRASCDACARGFYLVIGNPASCSPCPSRCAACSSSTRCTECKPRNL